MHAIAKSPTCVAVRCFVAHSGDSSRLFCYPGASACFWKAVPPTPAFKNTMQLYQPSDYTVEVQLARSGGRWKMFRKHNVTDASYLIPSHLEVWRLHSLNGLSTENNSRRWFQLITTRCCCYVDEREPISICSVLNVCSVLTEMNEIWRRYRT